MTTEDNHTQTIVDKLSQYRPLRTQRYAAVNVLLITWMHHDFGAGFDQETAELQGMFRDTFNYHVWPYKIPSQDPGRSLNACVAQFVKSFGGENNLMIVFYSGHGGPESETGVERSCIWAAKICGEPTLDWSEIQPQLFLASCDVAIILDSCYAGQAARSRTSRRVEFLAATDKDNYTPTGMGKWPSFTKVLTREMKQAVLTEGLVTLSTLQSRMVVAEAGLKRQPFLVSLAGGASDGPIKLSRLLEDPGRVESALTPVSASINSIYLRLCLFQPLDGTTSPSLLRWLTRDSPASVEDIQLIDQTLAEAQEINDLGMDCFGSRDVREGERMLSLLSNEGQAEAQRLLQDLRATLCDSGLTLPATRTVTRTILDNVKEASSRLVDFVADSFASMGEEALSDFRSCDSTNVEDIKERIAMRLTLLSDNALPDNPIRVNFRGNAAPGQRLRFGKQGNDDVLVEYIYYDSEDPLAFDRISYQVKRINALLSEPKHSAFRCLETSGFTHETLCGPRFGLVHPVPKALVNRKHVFLADLMNEVKNVSLDRRVRLAGIICDAVLHLHSVGWFHKNIKSENVVIFSLASSGDGSALTEEWDFENPFLVGFDCSRPADAETRDTVDFTTKNNIYRHPDRWGRSIRFEKHHDLYSLGILLMEIGCWRSLPSMDSKRSSFDYIHDPETLRSLLLKAVRTKLAHAAGTRYAEERMESL